MTNRPERDTTRRMAKTNGKAKAKKGKHIAKPLQSLAVPIDSLIVDPANARTHDAKNIQAIKDSLARFGQRSPVVVQKDGMIVRAGNGRVTAARELGWDHIAAVVVDESSVDATAFALADNRTAELAEWDDDALRLALSALEEDGVESVGWDDDDLATILGDMGKTEVVEDEVPEPPEEPTSKRGQLWALGMHRVLCGDNADTPADWEFDAVVTDPPYGMNYTGTAGTAQDGMANEQRREVDPIAGDDKDFDPAWVLGLTAGDVLLFGGDWFHHRLPGGGSWIVWDKRASEAADATPGAPFEVCWSRRRQERRFIRCPWGGWINKEKGDTDRHHPTQKPVAVMAECLKAAKGATILDPFLGSGTTLIAAEQLGRTCYGIEIEPRYVDVIIQRWENLTGEKAELLDG